MEYTNEIIEKIMSSMQKNFPFSKYYKLMSDSENLKVLSNRYLKRSERIVNCMDVWHWHKYEINKILDLQKVNRCMNNRFCSNCKKYDISRFTHNFKPHFKNLVAEGFTPFLLTLTIPNCKADKLSASIDLLYKNFTRLWRGYHENSQNAFIFRSFEFVAALKVLEITYNKLRDDFHPHLHCVVFINDCSDVNFFTPRLQGTWSNKRKSYNYHSHACVEIMKVWSMLYKKIRLSTKNFDDFNYDVSDRSNMLEVDFREMDEKGIYEVLKYTFKDSDISNYYVFRTFVLALEKRRIRQGYGLLYNLKTEDFEDGDLQDLVLEFEETPENLIISDVRDLIDFYSDFRKISRFTPNDFNDFD